MPDACRTPDGGMNFVSAEGPMNVAKTPVLRSGITPEQTVQRSLMHLQKLPAECLGPQTQAYQNS